MGSQPGAVRLLVASTAVVPMLAIAPTASAACRSVASVKSFHGNAGLTFSGTESGDDPRNGGTETVSLDREADSLQISLTTRKALLHGVYVFTGKATGGTISVTDTFDNTGTTFHGQETYSGPSSTANPNFTTVAAFLSTRTCKYQLQVGFDTATQYSGDPAVQPGASVNGLAYSDRMQIRRDLRLSGSAAPNAYADSCPGNPFLTGQGCYVFGGGRTTDFEGLAECQSVVAVNCGPAGPRGSAELAWALSPSSGSHKRHHRHHRRKHKRHLTRR
jgi:hypothetical protein